MVGIGDGFLGACDRCPGIDDTIFWPDCESAIPAASEWGLVVMTLLLLAGIKIKFGGRRASPV